MGLELYNKQLDFFFGLSSVSLCKCTPTNPCLHTHALLMVIKGKEYSMSHGEQNETSPPPFYLENGG